MMKIYHEIFDRLEFKLFFYINVKIDINHHIWMTPFLS